MTTGKSAQFSIFLGEIFEKSPVTGDFLRNKVLKIFCERDILRKLLCSKGLVTRDANTWSNFYSISIILNATFVESDAALSRTREKAVRVFENPSIVLVIIVY